MFNSALLLLTLSAHAEPQELASELGPASFTYEVRPFAMIEGDGEQTYQMAFLRGKDHLPLGFSFSRASGDPQERFATHSTPDPKELTANIYPWSMAFLPHQSDGSPTTKVHWLTTSWATPPIWRYLRSNGYTTEAPPTLLLSTMNAPGLTNHGAILRQGEEKLTELAAGIHPTTGEPFIAVGVQSAGATPRIDENNVICTSETSRVSPHLLESISWGPAEAQPPCASTSRIDVMIAQEDLSYLTQQKIHPILRPHDAMSPQEEQALTNHQFLPSVLQISDLNDDGWPDLLVGFDGLGFAAILGTEENSETEQHSIECSPTGKWSDKGYCRSIDPTQSLRGFRVFHHPEDPIHPMLLWTTST